MSLLPVLCTIISTVAAGETPIARYDLSYALQFKADNPASVADAWDHAHAVATLQGIVNRDAPRLYVRFVENGGKNIDDYWLAKLRMPGAWLARRTIQPVRTFPELLERFRDRIQGVVLYDPAVPATSNLASTIAGVEDLIAVRFDPREGSLYSRIVAGGPKLPVVRRLFNEDGSPLFTGRGTVPGTDLPSTGSAKCDAYLWLKAHYIDTGKVDAGYAGFYLDSYWLQRPSQSSPNQHTLTNHDFFVAKRAFFFDLGVWEDETPVDDPNQRVGTDLDTLKKLLLSAYEKAGRERMIHIGGFCPWAFKYTNHGHAGGKHEAVPTEWQYGTLFSAYNAFVDADAIGFAAMANASFYMHMPLKERYPQRWVTREQLIKRGLLDRQGRPRIDGREFIIFYVGDYDAASWVYQYMPHVWDHPGRGKLPLMWCISPVLDRRAGPMLDYLRRTASPNDYFAAADNGAGYLNPGMLQEPRPMSGLPSGLDAWARHCEPFYRRWDLTITGFVIDGFAPGLNKPGLDCYARFSPNGIVPQKVPIAMMHGEMPVLKADHDLPDSVEAASKTILTRTAARKLPFTWFRAILRSPVWYEEAYTKARAENPKIELLDGPAFFELLRIYLKANPDAAAGSVE